MENHIQALRNERRVTQQELADAVGVHGKPLFHSKTDAIMHLYCWHINWRSISGCLLRNCFYLRRNHCD